MRDSQSDRVFVLDPVPSGRETHVHECPVPDCGRQVHLRVSDRVSKPQSLKVASRMKKDERGEFREILRVRLPELCWCGAPLPGEERVAFSLSLVHRNREASDRIVEQLRKEEAMSRAAMEVDELPRKVIHFVHAIGPGLRTAVVPGDGQTVRQAAEAAGLSFKDDSPWEVYDSLGNYVNDVPASEMIGETLYVGPKANPPCSDGTCPCKSPETKEAAA